MPLAVSAQRLPFDKSPLPAAEMRALAKKFEYRRSSVQLVNLTGISVIPSAFKSFEGEVEGDDPAQVGQKISMKFKYYASQMPFAGQTDKHPVVIVLSTIAGVTVLESHIAEFLASKGISSVVPEYYHREFAGKNPISVEKIDALLIRGVVGIRMILDVTSHWKGVDTQRIGSIGQSLGSIINSILLGIEPRVQAGVLVAGGGHWPQIFAESEESRVAQYRKRIMAMKGFKNVDEFYNYFHRSVKLDGLYFAHLREAEDINFIIAGKDKKVLTETQWDLFEAYDRPRHRVYEKGHVETIADVTFSDLDTELYEFLLLRWR